MSATEFVTCLGYGLAIGGFFANTHAHGLTRIIVALFWPMQLGHILAESAKPFFPWQIPPPVTPEEKRRP